MQRWSGFAALTAAVLMLGATGTAQAREDCMLVPYQREVARGVYVLDTRLACRELVDDAPDILEQRHAWLALCRELVEHQKNCEEQVLKLKDPTSRAGMEQIQALVQQEREAAARSKEKPEAEGPPVMWRTPKLLTNGEQPATAEKSDSKTAETQREHTEELPAVSAGKPPVWRTPRLLTNRK